MSEGLVVADDVDGSVTEALVMAKVVDESVTEALVVAKRHVRDRGGRERVNFTIDTDRALTNHKSGTNQIPSFNNSEEKLNV